MAEIVWTEKSEKSLKSIFDYISKDSKFYVGKFISSLVSSARKLESFPKLGRVVPEFNIETIREIVFYNYRIVYRVNSDLIEILLVIHAARDFEKTFKKDWEI
ncbi:MAG: type II toxin-antitoxin system RelE/ParE family toxin [Ignavibacteria bacterium]|nr:type II toxin-antitoxin system RelE/ParE family toxin [Ignavibacteria bacterium]